MKSPWLVSTLLLFSGQSVVWSESFVVSGLTAWGPARQASLRSLDGQRFARLGVGEVLEGATLVDLDVRHGWLVLRQGEREVKVPISGTLSLPLGTAAPADLAGLDRSAGPAGSAGSAGITGGRRLSSAASRGLSITNTPQAEELDEPLLPTEEPPELAAMGGTAGRDGLLSHPDSSPGESNASVYNRRAPSEDELFKIDRKSHV